MNPNILYLNLFVVFILSLIIVATLVAKKENLKARLTFCFFFLNIIITCVNNLVTLYLGNHKLIFLQISLAGTALLYGPMLFQYTLFLLEKKLPKYWWLNYLAVFLVFVAGLYYLFIPEEIQKIYLKEMIDGEHLPALILNLLVLFHSIFYFIYVRLFLNKLKLDPNDVQLRLKKDWTSNFVNYMIFCNAVVILYYVVTVIFFADLLVFGDLVIVPLIILIIYSFIIIQSAQQHKEAELKYVLSQVETQNKLLQQRLSISRDLHDNIGSQLSFIISSVDTVKYAYAKQDDILENKLTNISNFAKDTIVELRDTVWALNSNQLLFEDLQSRITNFIEKANLSDEKIEFSFMIDEDVKIQKLSSVQGMHVYRTIQEAVHNAVKHAKATAISICIENNKTKKTITITDNGIGFDFLAVEKGNGLNNMKKRMEQIGGSFDLFSDNKGTRIEVLI